VKIRNAGESEQTIELQMTPMIDIVFQLLVFFIMTFKIVVLEGDFNIKMPASSTQPGDPDDVVLPLTVELRADSQGGLADIRINGDSQGREFKDLRDYVINYLGDDRGPGSVQETAEVEFDCAFNLKYEETVKAITAVSGYKDGEGNIVKLIEKIKFTPPDENAEGG